VSPTVQHTATHTCAYLLLSQRQVTRFILIYAVTVDDNLLVVDRRATMQSGLTLM